MCTDAAPSDRPELSKPDAVDTIISGAQRAAGGTQSLPLFDVELPYW